MSESGVLDAGFALAANENFAPKRAGRGRFAADPTTIALICASRLGTPGFRILSAPNTPIRLTRDASGVFTVGRRPTG